MKVWIFLISLLVLLQMDSCGEDDSLDDGGSINENFVEFLGERNDANGGCNVESTTGDFSCTYSGAYTDDGLGYAIAVTHEGLCRTATFNLRDNIDQSSNAFFILQVTENGVAIDTYLGSSGTIMVTDTGVVTSLEFSGTVVNTVTGEEEEIEGFMECPL